MVNGRQVTTGCQDVFYIARCNINRDELVGRSVLIVPNLAKLSLHIPVLIDRFGSVMYENLQSRGCLLSGVAACKDSDSQIQR